MKNQEYLIIEGAELGSDLFYSGEGNINEWKEKMGSKLRKRKKYAITNIFSGSGPYDIPYFYIRRLSITPNEWDDHAYLGGCVNKIREIGFELDDKTKGLLKKLVKNL
ncbi:MAG: hypothetical protein PHH54_06800 [Candidatus Nanoarchaeia archaeon]|nr:hypothetical protein [Candidatus Nanoarchaeia archaeon]MDD5741664.1 hypothetical protein [Candidatus Nanoarchaeia archaeon]